MLSAVLLFSSPKVSSDTLDMPASEYAPDFSSIVGKPAYPTLGV